jgi:hypothetical protein
MLLTCTASFLAVSVESGTVEVFLYRKNKLIPRIMTTIDMDNFLYVLNIELISCYCTTLIIKPQYRNRVVATTVENERRMKGNIKKMCFSVKGF